MKKERKKVLLVWVMTLAMLFGVLQPAVGMNEVRAEEGTVSEQNEVGVKYEALPKEPMKTSATASSYQETHHLHLTEMSTKDGTVSMIPRQDLTGSSGRLEEFTT